jgi:hypothetical protein
MKRELVEGASKEVELNLSRSDKRHSPVLGLKLADLNNEIFL